MLNLIENELLKLFKNKRFALISILLVIIISMFAYGAQAVFKNNQEKFQGDFRASLQQRITDLQNSLSSPRVLEEFKKYRIVLIKQLEYYLKNDIDPSVSTGPAFVSGFLDQAVSLLFPLLVVALGADLINGEISTGTMKFLLTRPRKRWKILMSKWIAFLILVSVMLMIAGVLSYLIGGLVFGYGGWDALRLTGFQISHTNYIHTENIQAISLWKYTCIEFGLVWFSCIVVASFSLLCSILLKSAAASIITPMSLFIASLIVVNAAPELKLLSYFFPVNLRLSTYLEGTLPPIQGMTFGFSLGVLGVWGVCSLVIGFFIFNRRDVY